MADKIQLRRDLAANWTSANPVLAQGEPALELDTGLEKIGDGATTWNLLPYRFPDQTAAQVPVSPSGNLTSIDAQSALEELQADIDGLSTSAITDHDQLLGLTDDDHPQYLNNSRGDIRYYQKSEVDTLLEAQDEAIELGYDDTNTSFGSVTNIQEAIEALNSKFTKEYFQSSQITAQLSIGTSDVVLATIENQNSNTSVFNFSSNNLTINKGGAFQFFINVSGNTGTGSRETLRARLQRFNGTSFVDIPLSEAHTEGHSYHRNNPSGKDTISISPILTVTSGQQFRVVLNSTTNGVDTIPRGTGITVEEK